MTREPMRRREFITLLGGAAVAWPLAARAQQPAVPVIGFLNSQSFEQWSGRVAAVRRGLDEAGYVEGRNVAIQYRWAENRVELLPSLAVDLVGRQVQVIVASGGDDVAKAAIAATSSIPIVATFAEDPVDRGFVASLNRPGGNVTGVSLFTSTLVAKQFDLLHQAVPGSGAIAVVWNSGSKRLTETVEAAALALGEKLLILNVSNEREIDAAFAAIIRQSARALFVVPNPLFITERRQFVSLAAKHRLPAMYYTREFTEAGGLMSYANNREDDYRQLGVYVGRVLKGAKPADLPVTQPTKFELFINLKTMKALGLELPPKVLALANEVIE
jgi:putative ABC transport system substrate-binding protein